MILFAVYIYILTVLDYTIFIDTFCIEYREHARFQLISSRDGGESLAFLIIKIFTEGHTNLHPEAIRPKGSHCFSRGFHTNISKEAFSHLGGCDWVKMTIWLVFRLYVLLSLTATNLAYTPIFEYSCSVTNFV